MKRQAPPGVGARRTRVSAPRQYRGKKNACSTGAGVFPTTNCSLERRGFEFVTQPFHSLLRIPVVHEITDHSRQIGGVVRVGFEVILVLLERVLLVSVNVLDYR